MDKAVVPRSPRTVGVPVTYGLEKFRNRDGERETLARLLVDPEIRMVTVMGRRGIGKSALAAKVLDDAGERRWPHDVTALTGVVYMSSRTSGISLERLFLDCARLLGGQREQKLRDTWARPRATHDKIAELFEALDEETEGRYVILFDNLEDRLTDDGRLDDEGLNTFIELLFRVRRSPCLLVTTQVPLALPPQLLRYEARLHLETGLPELDGIQLLRELDRNGEAGLRDAPLIDLGRAVARVHGVPRALELVVGAMAEDYLTLPTLDELLRTFAQRGDMLAELVQERYLRLNKEGRLALQVLAVFGRPTPRQAVEYVFDRLAPSLDPAPALARLARVQLITVADRANKSFALHPMDVDLVYGELQLQGIHGKISLERHVADWYMSNSKPENEWTTVEDASYRRLEFEHRVRAGDYDGATRVLNSIAEFLVWRGSVREVVSMHLAVHDKIHDKTLRAAHLLDLGFARMIGGPIEEAAEHFECALSIAVDLGDRRKQERALSMLGDAYRKMRRLDEAIDTLSRAAEIARELDDLIHESYSLLGLSLTYSYCGDVDQALHVVARMNAQAQKTDDPHVHGRVGDARSVAEAIAGRWENAIAAAEEALEWYQRGGIGESIGYTRNIQGLGYIALGQTDIAITTFQQGCEDGSSVETPRVEGLCFFNMAWAYWLTERYAEAYEAAERSGDAFRRAGGSDATTAEALSRAARAIIAGDMTSAAEMLIRTAELSRGNADFLPPAWLTTEAARLAHSIGSTTLEDTALAVLRDESAREAYEKRRETGSVVEREDNQ